jgi:alpha-glucosidase
MKISSIYSIGVTILLLSQMACSKSIRSVPGGILVNMDSNKVLLTTAGDHSFRLGLRTKYTGEIPSIFLDKPRKSSAKFRIVKNGDSYGIETSYGKLMLNKNSKTWSLSDSSLKVVIREGSLLFSDTLQQIEFASKGNCYGSGNYNIKSLIKESSASKMGNGTTDIPYLWNETGFALLGITENDDKPASWKRQLNNNLTWSFKGSSADLYLWTAKDLYQGTQGLLALTGQAKIPPLWAFGFLQSRWGWQDRDDIENSLKNFRNKKLPVDAFIYDFEWYTKLPDYGVKENGVSNYSDFNFNPKLFPSPVEQIKDYHQSGLKFIGIRKPRIGDSLSLVLARKKGWIVQSAYNNRDLDFRNPDLRSWYIQKNKPLLNAGVDAWWNDEGEAYYTCYYWWNKAQYDLLAQERPGARQFSINRSFSPGNQRLGYCTWNGDIKSDWRNLLETPADMLNWSLSGMFYSSCDIGGFGEKDPEKEVIVRWYQAATFFPVMRAHSNIGTTAHFPWMWDENAIKKALNLRYRLLPFIYSLAHEGFTNGRPIMRPLIMEFPDDEKVANMTDQWLLGSGLMAAPVMNAGGVRKVYLPNDNWYNFFTGEKLTGNREITVNAAWDEVPVYVRAGTILPLGALVQNTDERSTEPLEIRIYPGKNGSFTLTEDDGKTYGYINNNVRNTYFKWDDDTKTLSWTIKGTYETSNTYKAIKVIIGKQEHLAQLGPNRKVSF